MAHILVRANYVCTLNAGSSISASGLTILPQGKCVMVSWIVQQGMMKQVVKDIAVQVICDVWE